MRSTAQCYYGFMSNFWTHLEKTIRSDWVLFVLAVVAILAITAIVSLLVTKFLRKLLHYNKENNLPSSSIFVNIARAAIWIIGVCVMLSTCFNVDVSAMIAALGVGGIAVSLGFQNTLSNLIAGLQISLMHIVKPGDIINVATETGVVKDVNWWNTTIIDDDGNTILIPNSKLVTSSLKHVLPINEVSIKIGLTIDGKDIDTVSKAIEKEALRAAMKVGPVQHAPEVDFTGVSDFGYEAVICFVMERESDNDGAIDAIVRAIAPLLHATDVHQALQAVEQKETPSDAHSLPSAQQDSPDVVNAQLEAEKTIKPLVQKGSSPADVAAATVSTLEGVLLGKQPARKRVAHALQSLKGKSHRLKSHSKASKKKHEGKSPAGVINPTVAAKDSQGSAHSVGESSSATASEHTLRPTSAAAPAFTDEQTPTPMSVQVPESEPLTSSSKDSKTS